MSEDRLQPMSVISYLPLVFKQAGSVEALAGMRVNAPYFNGDIRYPQMAIFWFGQVSSTENYADVRAGYNNEEIYINLATFDRWLWYDTSPTPGEFADWDSISLYLNMDGNAGDSPGVHSFRFDAQLNWWEQRQDYQATYRGNDAGWVPASLPFTTTSGWQGEVPNNNDKDDRGWVGMFHIPFSSLGMSGPPHGRVWGLGLTLYDRDDAPGSPISPKSWPVGLESFRPVTWGQIHFGLPAYSPPPAAPGGTVTIRNGLNGAVVPDAGIGGTTGNLCPGNAYYIWNTWGNANFAGATDFNIQNQANLGDWPCFSKYYVTFPLGAVPNGKVILSATLTLHLFGNAGGGQWGQPPDSYIQALSVSADWEESTLTWNNAPLAQENLSGSRVYPVDPYPGCPGVAYTWDVSGAVARALEVGDELRLSLYSADGPMHSGKYFRSSDTDDICGGRPTLEVVWGD